jgi:putative sigma-54 modulation protein
MYVSIQGRHLEITPAIHEYVKNKLKKIKYYFDQIVHAHVVLEVVKNTHVAEGTVTVERTHFHNKVTSDDLYKSIDMLFDKLDRQASKHKEAHGGHGRVGLNKREKHEQELEGLKSNVHVQITPVEVSIKPMDDVEAVLQLRADSHLKHFGYYCSDVVERPHFIHQVDEAHYIIWSHDGHWERREVELVGDKRLQVNKVESIRIATETIEGAADYLEQHPSECRLFRSVYTRTILFMYRIKAGQFGLLQEKLGK